MTTAVNFLPWREARRRQQLRVALLYAVGFLLLLLTMAQVNRAERHAVEALAAGSPNPPMAALRLLSASIRKFAVTTTASPSLRPLST